MATDQTPNVQEQNIHHHFKNIGNVMIISIVLIGFVTTFLSGFFLSHLLSSEPTLPPSQPTPTGRIPYVKETTPYPTSNNPQTAQDTTKFLPGKYYFEDDVIIITKDQPHQKLIATVSRAEQEKDYTQNTRVSYFDGTSWTRQKANRTASDSTIISNNLVKSWKLTVDPSRVLKQTVQGEITINNSLFSFSSEVLQNEIGMRSLPGYTKFMSNGTGTVTINGGAHSAYILYTRIYSLNASDIQFYSQPLGVTTDWIAFWDTAGNFYHVDTTSVEKKTPIYESHQIGIRETTDGSVTKTFGTTVTRDAKNPPSEYSVSLLAPIGETLQFTRIDGIDKAPGSSYTWYMGSIEGTVTTASGEKRNGIGLVEYIHD